jgi:putative ABC transport system substrate-binding protein
VNRRVLLRWAGGLALAWPFVARAQQSADSRRIAFVHSGIPADELTEAAGPFWVKRFI